MVGYPTQKPVKLVKRIISASSNEGDLVLDPFAGCATAAIAAEDLGRRWVGIDLSEKAAELVKFRLEEHLGLFYDVIHRTDLPQRTDLGDLPPYRSHKRDLFGEQAGPVQRMRHRLPLRQSDRRPHRAPQTRRHRPSLQPSTAVRQLQQPGKAPGTMSEFDGEVAKASRLTPGAGIVDKDWDTHPITARPEQAAAGFL